MIGNHRTAAEVLLGAAADIGKYIQDAENIRAADMYAALQSAGVSGSMATAHAVLAVEARLGEIGRALNIANVVAAFGSTGAIRNDADFREASRTVNALLFPDRPQPEEDRS